MRDLGLLLLQLHITEVRIRVLSTDVQTWKNNNGYILSKCWSIFFKTHLYLLLNAFDALPVVRA